MSIGYGLPCKRPRVRDSSPCIYWYWLHEISIEQSIGAVFKVLNLPVCVRICRFNRLGRSKALPQTSHGKRARSPRVGRAFGEDRGIVIDVSIISPALLAADDDVDDSPDTDLCSSSPAEFGGDMGSSTRDNNDMDRSSGDSGRK